MATTRPVASYAPPVSQPPPRPPAPRVVTSSPRPTPPEVQPPVERRAPERSETSITSTIGTNVDIRA